MHLVNENYEKIQQNHLQYFIDEIDHAEQMDHILHAIVKRHMMVNPEVEKVEEKEVDKLVEDVK